jgi:hypothetical protein
MPAWNGNRLTSKLGIDYPIVQGPPWLVLVAKTDRSGLQLWRTRMFGAYDLAQKVPSASYPGQSAKLCFGRPSNQTRQSITYCG